MSSSSVRLNPVSVPFLVISRLPCRLESENDSSGRLRRMCPAVSVQGRESEVRILVHKTSVFSPQREVLRQSVVGACSVQESASPLSASAGNRSAIVAGGTKGQTAAPSERVSTDPSDAKWKGHHQIRSDRVHVGLDSGFAETTKIFLSISVETIIPFRREPTVDVITVSHEKPTGVCGAPGDTTAASIPREKPCALQTDVGAAFLSPGAKS